MKKKGLDWYKNEMMNKKSKYTFKNILKMLENEFEIPIFINRWIEKKENQEVYEIYKKIREMKRGWKASLFFIL